MTRVLAIFALLLAAAVASHYRYGTMYYVPTGLRTIRLSIDQAWRRSAFGAPNVGTIFTPGGIDFGNGQGANLDLTTTSINLVDDIVSGSVTYTRTYAADTSYTISFSTCCRISSLRNNADGNLRSFTTVDFAQYPNNRSPVSSVLPIVSVPRGSPAYFPITAIDPDGDSLTYRLATTAEFAGNSHPSGVSVDSVTGIYSWNNQALTNGLYNTAVVISDGKCLMMVDFLMNLVNIQQSNNPPTWTGNTPADQTAFTALVGNPISFSLECTDQDVGQTVNIQSGVLPQGASLTAQSGSNPGSRTFTFTSSVPTTSVACFSCADNLASSTPQVCVTLNIQGGCCDLTTTPPVLNGVPSDLSLECGASVPSAPTVTVDPLCPDGASPIVVTPSETTTGSVCNRVITRTWSYTNICGRSVTDTQVITIRDTTAPLISTSGAPSTTVQCGSSTSTSATGTVSASDNCDNSVTIASTDTTTPSSCLAVASISRRWTATDDCSNVASYTQTINVVDNSVPTLTVPADVTRQCAVQGYGPADTGYATASDVCDSSVTPTYSDANSAVGCLALGRVSRTWTATDDCGNSVSGVQTINFQDTLNPTTSVDPVCVFPPNGQYYCFDTTNPDFLHYSDACSTVSHLYNNDCQDNTGDRSGCVAVGNQICVRASTDRVQDTTYSFSFTVTDACGNYVNQAATITVPNQVSASTASCRAPTVCINDCPEGQCEGDSFDLLTEDGDLIGSVFISNKLDYELQIEVKTNEGSVPERGWWMLGLNIQVGTKRVVKDWSRNNAQSRWFATIDLTADGVAECGADLDVIVAVLATNDKRNNNGRSVRAYPATGSKRSFTLPPNIQDYAIHYEICCECTLRTQTQNDFGNLCYAQPAPSKRTNDSPRIREIACYTHDFWTWSAGWCFPSGLVVGCSSGYTVTYTNPTAVATGWADETSARVLSRSWVDPARGQVGSLAAETAALTLNTRLDECDADFSSSCSHLTDYYVCEHPNSDHPDCQPFWGQTVGSILSQANAVLGGCQSGNANALATCVRFINRAFVDGKRLWEAADFRTNSCSPSK